MAPNAGEGIGILKRPLPGFLAGELNNFALDGVLALVVNLVNVDLAVGSAGGRASKVIVPAS